MNELVGSKSSFPPKNTVFLKCTENIVQEEVVDAFKTMKRDRTEAIIAAMGFIFKLNGD